MNNEPIWRIKSEPLAFPCLEKNLEVDVAIIGGGITGITTAYLLKQKGIKCALLEARKIGKGTTGQSTGNLYEITEYTFDKLGGKYSLEELNKILTSRRSAMNMIEKNVGELQLDCDFKTQPMYLYHSDEQLFIDKEEAIAKDLNLDYRKMRNSDIEIPFKRGLVFNQQAQLNPLKYVQGLAAYMQQDKDCEIYENTRVTEIEEKEDGILISTAQMRVVKAQKVVQATHTPIGLQVQYHTALGPYREYGVAAPLTSEKYPEGIFWGHFGDKKISIRTYYPYEAPYIIAVGSMHKVGQGGDNQERIEELKGFVRKHFDVGAFTHQWGGQNYKAADMLPYIGRKKTGSDQYIATGFSTDGLVYGTLAAMILSDEIAGVENEYAEFYKASRHRPIKAAGEFIKENIDVVGKLIGDSVKKGAEVKTEDLPPNSGRMIQLEEGKFAVYKNERNELKILSPICPHMGCTVHWNNAEKTWDCPCHGSRFDTEGKVIEGPALDGLEEKSGK